MSESSTEQQIGEVGEVSQVKAGVDLGRVRRAIEPALSARGVSLADLEWLTERGAWTLRLTIEREDAVVPGAWTPEKGFGVNLEDCADVSRDVSAILDLDEDIIPAHYTLEVSSPGLDRSLKSNTDFARFVGNTVKVKLRKPAPDGQRVLRGPLAAANDGRIAVVVDGKRIEAPLADVVEANLVFELRPQPKKSDGVAKAKPKKPKR
jgi:ribosome maturation factor RimP